jgi:hypothetical protein
MNFNSCNIQKKTSPKAKFLKDASQYRKNRNREQTEPHINLKKVSEMLEKRPEEIVVKLGAPWFGFDLYLNADTMTDEMALQMVKLVEKALECSNMKLKLKEHIAKFANSKLLLTHIYALMNRKVSITQNIYNYSLIKSVLNITCLMIELDYNLLTSAEIIKDRLELIIKNRMKDVDELVDEFDNRLVKISEEAYKYLESRRNHKTFKNLDSASMEPPEDFTEMSIVPRLNDILIDQVTTKFGNFIKSIDSLIDCEKNKMH